MTTQPTTTPRRGDCHACGLDYQLTKNGTVYRHNGMTPAGFSTGEKGPGSGRLASSGSGGSRAQDDGAQ